MNKTLEKKLKVADIIYFCTTSLPAKKKFMVWSKLSSLCRQFLQVPSIYISNLIVSSKISTLSLIRSGFLKESLSTLVRLKLCHLMRLVETCHDQSRPDQNIGLKKAPKTETTVLLWVQRGLNWVYTILYETIPHDTIIYQTIWNDRRPGLVLVASTILFDFWGSSHMLSIDFFD